MMMMMNRSYPIGITAANESTLTELPSSVVRRLFIVKLHWPPLT